MSAAGGLQSRHYELALLTSRVLIFYPVIGLTQADFETCVRLPVQDLLDECVVAISASHTTWRSEIIFSGQFYPGDRFDFRHEFINRYDFA